MLKAMVMYFIIMLFILLPPLPVQAVDRSIPLPPNDISISTSSPNGILNPGASSPLVVDVLISSTMEGSIDGEITVVVTGLNGQAVCSCHKKYVTINSGISSVHFVIDTTGWESGAYSIMALLPEQKNEYTTRNNVDEIEIYAPYVSDFECIPIPDIDDCGYTESEPSPFPEPTSSPILPPFPVPPPVAPPVPPPVNDVAISISGPQMIGYLEDLKAKLTLSSSFEEPYNIHSEIVIYEVGKDFYTAVDSQYLPLSGGSSDEITFTFPAGLFKPKVLYEVKALVVQVGGEVFIDNNRDSFTFMRAENPEIVDIRIDAEWTPIDDPANSGAYYAKYFRVHNYGTVRVEFGIEASNGTATVSRFCHWIPVNYTADIPIAIPKDMGAVSGKIGISAYETAKGEIVRYE